MPETAQNAASKLSESFSVGNCQIPVIFLADNRNLIFFTKYYIYNR